MKLAKSSKLVMVGDVAIPDESGLATPPAIVATAKAKTVRGNWG